MSEEQSSEEYTESGDITFYIEETPTNKRDVSHQPRGEDGKFISKELADRDKKIEELEAKMNSILSDREAERKQQEAVRLENIRNELAKTNPVVAEKYKDVTDITALSLTLDALKLAGAPQRPPSHLPEETEPTDKMRPAGYVGGFNPDTGEWE